MKGDFTRNTFDPGKHFSRVLMQRGRVQLDADWNELNAIVLHYVRTLAADIIGPYGGPDGSFEIARRKDKYGNVVPEDFVIGPGHYYVDGILCENDREVSYTEQHPDYPLQESEQLKQDVDYLAYLDVWERHITYIQDDSIREVALGGPDTATRAKIVWQVKTWDWNSMRGCPSDEEWSSLVEQWQPENRGKLKAETKEFQGDESTEPCNIPPESKYRGAENQLYRAEIHDGGMVGTATFKWSRENGSVVFPILKVRTTKGTNDNKITVETTLEHLGRDERFSLNEGDWVEIVDEGITLRGEANSLLQVKSIDRDRLVVTLEPSQNDHDYNDYDYNEISASHPLLRRWDQKKLDPTLGYPKMANNGAVLVEEDKWLLLEDGIQVFFEPVAQSAKGKGFHTYRTGDYWLIPARTATGDVEWPRTPSGEPTAIPPDGVEHHYAPLAIISLGHGHVTAIDDCRCTFVPHCPAEQQ